MWCDHKKWSFDRTSCRVSCQREHAILTGPEDDGFGDVFDNQWVTE